MPIQNLNPDVLMMEPAEDWFHGAGRGGLRALRYPRKPKHPIPCDLAIVLKHPEKAPAEILRDLIQSTPGEEGKWFATAKEAGLLDLAIELANRSPTDPQTLTRAARDFMDRNPVFALEAGLAANGGFVADVLGRELGPSGQPETSKKS